MNFLSSALFMIVFSAPICTRRLTRQPCQLPSVQLFLYFLLDTLLPFGWSLSRATCPFSLNYNLDLRPTRSLVRGPLNYVLV